LARSRELGTFTLRDSIVRDNTLRGGAAINGWLGNGGGVEAIEAEVHLDRVSIVHNRAIGDRFQRHAWRRGRGWDQLHRNREFHARADDHKQRRC
jgi:hypothetical protein